MATIIQLSETTYVNMDQATVLRFEEGQWRLWLSDPHEDLALTDAERAVLALYLKNHVARATYHTYAQLVQETTP